MTEYGNIGTDRSSLTIIIKSTQQKTILGDSHSSINIIQVLNVYTGNINITNQSKSIFQKIPMWAYSYNSMMDTFGSITGRINIDNLDMTNWIVRLYYKPNGFRITECKTNATGNFRFDYLEIDKPYYTVVSYRDEYNTVSIDAIKPVPTSTLPPITWREY